ncbi:putative HAD superfamily hydrolase [Myriangium duriaei CBS 260.36]|uniref:HAD superfamily hydrolase n=1 Tax=Myriangium duriaei CBS 260.36 TaxID=1168546 RepID=A0A9P4J0T5_9PEZI|nr:putative HAD superfamily hydrolase [Myriangium duriaei CBS 260.36]
MSRSNALRVLKKPSGLSLRQPCISTRFLHSSRPLSAPQDIAFAFDIDGVLLRSSQPVGGSENAVRQLQSADIPFIFLTNGGGKSELARVKDLRSKLGIESLREDAIIQSHTPFRDLKHLHDKNVLVIGGDGEKCRGVAQSYGYKSVILPADIWAARPDVWPFSSNFSSYYDKIAKPLPTTENLKIDAILVFNDPRDFGLDLAITIDLLLSSQGVVGTLSPKNKDPSLPNRGFQQDGQPELHFSNPDLWWASSYPLSRLGQGAFREALEGVWAAITGGAAAGVTLQKEVIGKPFQGTYEFAEKQLRRNRERIATESGRSLPPLRKVYMIGDNPESDIAGANNYKSPHGTEWVSVLVRTGVWRGGEPAHVPKMISKDVFAAVQWAMQDAEHK